MKLYFDPRNKWCLIMEHDTDPKKKHYMAIPPTDGDRVDLYTQGSIKNPGYIFGFKGIIIRIRKGIPTAELIE